MKYLFLLFFSLSLSSFGQKTSYFSALMGETSKTDSALVKIDDPSKIEAKIEGKQAGNFKVLDYQNTGEGQVKITYRFEPDQVSRGISRASLLILNNKKIQEVIDLVGIAIPALEGENEAPLSQVLDALGYSTDIGWKTLPNHVRPELQGEEINAGLFRKAFDGPVKITPIARYSPPSLLPFGFYVNTENGPALSQTGILADSENFHEHQALFPALAQGAMSFDPVNATFGFYVASETHTSFTEDIWNMVYSRDHASHSARIYPVKDKEGNYQPNSYLLCYEEAANGDYQDFVFLVENVRPVNPEQNFTNLLHQNDLDGWDIYMDEFGLNKDPNHMFTLKDGLLKVVGKDLGYIITDKSYENYHFKVDFKWGEKKWPPRLNDKRDSGICYHIPSNDPNKVWPLSVECQIQEGDVGDFWLLGFNTIMVDGKQNIPKQYSNLVKSKDNERPHGEWNTVEVLSFNGKCIHIVNGMVVNYGTESSLRKGRILLQSEYAEVYYKNVKIREL